MTVNKNTLIIVLVLLCGILAGTVLAGLAAPRPVQVKQVIYSEKAPQPIGPYSQAVQSGDLVFLSGQVGYRSRYR